MNNFINYSGKKIGRLTVSDKWKRGKASDGHAEIFWLCLCSCGREKWIPGRGLKKIKSCGCVVGRKPKNLSGQKIGKLTITDKHKSENGFVRWWCICDCGNELWVSAHSLHTTRRRILHSCGCSALLSPEEVVRNRIYGQMKNVCAKRRGLVWELTKEQMYDLIISPCHYCGIKNSLDARKKCPKRKDIDFYYNGIDRINNFEGYVIGNVVPCCSQCNYAKRNMTVEEFYNWRKRFSEYYLEEKERNNERPESIT